MTEQSGEDKYIKCSKCKCKYINDDNHIRTDFGFNRLSERFKTCTKCRNKTSKTNNLLDILPDNVIDTIHKYKHQMEFQDVTQEMMCYICDIEYLWTKPIGCIRHPVFSCRHCGVSPWKTCTSHCTAIEKYLGI